MSILWRFNARPVSAAIQVGFYVPMGGNVQVRLSNTVCHIWMKSNLKTARSKRRLGPTFKKNCNFQEELYVFPTLNQSGPPDPK